MPTQPILLYVYGPPASGKLTVAREVAAATGYRLFHNQLTVNALTPVFDFGSPEFSAVLHRLRLDVFATAMGMGRSLVFTNNSAWSGPDPRRRLEEFVATTLEVVTAAGGRCVLFVQLTAPPEVLEARVANEARAAHGKLVDAVRLRELLATLDPAPLHDDDLVVDTGGCSPADAALEILPRIGAPG